MWVRRLFDDRSLDSIAAQMDTEKNATRIEASAENVQNGARSWEMLGRRSTFSHATGQTRPKQTSELATRFTYQAEYGFS